MGETMALEETIRGTSSPYVGCVENYSPYVLHVAFNGRDEMKED